MTAAVARKLSQSNPELAVSHISLQRSLEGLGSNESLSNKALDIGSVGKKTFSDQLDSQQSFYSKGLSNLRRRLSLSNQRSKLVYMDKIAALEVQLSSLVNAVSERAAELNSKSPRATAGTGFPSSGSKESLPKCEEIGNCWSWIVQLSRLSQIHITYAAEYHKFFFEARELEASLEQEKARVFADLSSGGGERRSLGSLPFECRRLSSCMRAHLSRLMLLGQRAQELAGRSGSVQPVHHRLQQLPASSIAGGKRASSSGDIGRLQRRAVALCSFTSPEGLRVHMDEEVVVVDMADRHAWRVEKLDGGGGQLDLPSVCLALLGPDPEAREAMTRLRDTIVAVWVQILTSYKQHVGDLFRSFLEFLLMEKYTTDSDAAEASLFSFMSELESGYLCYLNDSDSAGFIRLLGQIRARRTPPSEQAVRASRERRLSNVSLSSVASTDVGGAGGGGGGGGLGRSESHRGSRRTRSLKESEVIQPRALLKVLNEHVEALERLRSRRVDAQPSPPRQSTSEEVALRSPALSVPAIQVQNDEETSNNVYVFSNRTDAEKAAVPTQRDHQKPPTGQRRTRNLSAASSRTITSTMMNEEVHQLLGMSTTDGPSGESAHNLLRSSSALGDPSPSANEPQRHVSRMYWMVNQPTRVERQIHRAELTVRRQLAVDLPHRNFVSAKRLQLDDEENAGVYTVRHVECNLPPPRPDVVDSGASLDFALDSRSAQTVGDFKVVQPTTALAVQTEAPEVSECATYLDFASVNAEIRVEEEPPERSDTSAQTSGEFKAVQPTLTSAVQTQKPLANECGAHLDFASINASAQAEERPPPRSDTSAQTAGEFQKVRPMSASAMRSRPPPASECGASFDFTSIEQGVRAAEKPPPRAETSAQTAGEFKEVRPTVALATQTQQPELKASCAFKDFASVEAGIRAIEEPKPTSDSIVQTVGKFKEVRPTSALAIQTQLSETKTTGVRKSVASVEADIRVVEEPTPTSDSLAQTVGQFKEVFPTAALATQTQKPAAKTNGVFREFATAIAAIHAVEKPPVRSTVAAQTSGAFKEVLPTAALATQTQKLLAKECGASRDFASLGATVCAAQVIQSASVRAIPAPPKLADCSAHLALETRQANVRLAEPQPEPGVASLVKGRPAADAFAEAASQANFQLEVVARLLVRNHNLEEARLLSLDRREASQYEEVVSAGQARLLKGEQPEGVSAMACREWSELGSLHTLEGEEGEAP